MGFPERAPARPNSHAKKEITMTKSHHKDTVADTGTAAVTDTDTVADTVADTDTYTGAGAGAGGINPFKKGTVPFLLSLPWRGLLR